jgi:hypothetical protein
MPEPRSASRPMRATRPAPPILPPSARSFLPRCIRYSFSPPFASESTMDRVSGLPEPPRSEPVLPPPSQEIPSSPPSVTSEAGGGRRPRKPPTVTPRSFRRFFTPRSLLNSGNASGVKTSRQALRALTSPAVNRLGPAFTRSSKASSPSSPHHGLPEEVFRTPSRKRKHSFSSVASPLQSSPLKKVRVRSPVGDDVEQRNTVRDIDLASIRGRFREPTPPSPPKRRSVSPISRSRALQTSGSLFMRTVQGSRAGRMTLRSTAGAGRFIPFLCQRHVI